MPEVLNILKEKKAGNPPVVQKKPVQQKQNYLSAEYITDEDSAEDIPQKEANT